MVVADHIHEDDLQLYTTGRLPADRVSAVNTHVCFCQQCATKLEEAAVFVAQTARLKRTEQRGRTERRIERRIPTEDHGLLQVLQPLSVDHLVVMVINTSLSGLGLRVPIRLEPGALVQIRLEGSVVLGEVRYCVKADGQFHAGVQVEDVYQTARSAGIA